MSDYRPVRRALISVSDKTGLVPLGQRLAALNIHILINRRLSKAFATLV